MLRILGAVFISCGCACFGLRAVVNLRERVRILSALIGALETMRAEIGERLTPLREITEMLRADSRQPLELFFGRVCAGMAELGSRPFNAIWRRALHESPELRLRETELEVLADLGAALGRYDADSQTRAIGYAKRRLDTFLQNAEQEKARQSKVYGAVSITAGLAIVIVLL